MKILYLIHVCWEWIFQRPQILELLLENDFECTVVNKKFILGKKTSKDNKMPLNMKIAYQLPKADSSKVIQSINNILYKNALKDCMNYDAIWVCHPYLYDFIPKKYKGKIIYDCMDDHVSMAKETDKEMLKKSEQALISRADIIFATSNRLLEVVPNLQNAVLVRNGFEATTIMKVKQPEIKNTYKIGYFGTISSWFDFDLLSCSINNSNKIEYHLIGPVEKGIRNKVNYDNKRIVFEGVIEHSKLFDYVQDYDALIMPFIINDIILSVDPVKLYEYVSLGKCIISPWYPEIERFNPFVYFYHNKDEYLNIISELENNGFPPKYDSCSQNEFLKKNSWECRYELIKSEIFNVLK